MFLKIIFFFRFLFSIIGTSYGSVGFCKNYYGGVSCDIYDLSESEAKEKIPLPSLVWEKPSKWELRIEDVIKVELFTYEDKPALDHIPREIFSYFPNLADLTVDSQVKEITADDIVNVTELTDLNLKSNKLSKLTKGSLQYSFNGSLTFDDNQIETIDEFTFTNQSRLRSLHLEGNKLTVIKQNTFVGLSTLRVLILRANEIRTIEGNAFADLTKLEYIYLDKNKIETIGDFAFSGQGSLGHLYLYENKLTTISRNTFKGLFNKSGYNYANFDISKNEIHSIENGAFANMSNLKYLSLSENKIKMLNDHVFDGLTSLENIGLNKNQLEMETIGDSLQSLPSVKSLGLSFNKIGAINFAKFARLPSLKSIFLEASKVNLAKLTPVDPKLSIWSLDFLDLSSNNLTSAEGLDTVHRIFPSLTFLALKGNNFDNTTSQKIRDIFPAAVTVTGLNEFN